MFFLRHGLVRNRKRQFEDLQAAQCEDKIDQSTQIGIEQHVLRPAMRSQSHSEDRTSSQVGERPPR